MKKNMKFLIIAVSMLSAIGLTACDDQATMDMDGPDIDFTFAYPETRSASTSDWTLIASDTVPGENIEKYLAKDTANAAKADAVKSASILNGVLTVTGGNFNFDGVDSVKISYQIVNTTQEFKLIVGYPRVGNKDTIYFNKIKIEKAEALDLLGKDKIVKMSAMYNPAFINCFQVGAIFNFKASVKFAVLVSQIGNL